MVFKRRKFNKKSEEKKKDNVVEEPKVSLSPKLDVKQPKYYYEDIDIEKNGEEIPTCEFVNKRKKEFRNKNEKNKTGELGKERRLESNKEDMGHDFIDGRKINCIAEDEKSAVLYGENSKNENELKKEKNCNAENAKSYKLDSINYKNETESNAENAKSYKLDSINLKNETESNAENAKSYKLYSINLKNKTECIDENAKSDESDSKNLKNETNSNTENIESYELNSKNLKNETNSNTENIESYELNSKTLKNETNFKKETDSNTENKKPNKSEDKNMFERTLQPYNSEMHYDDTRKPSYSFYIDSIMLSNFKSFKGDHLVSGIDKFFSPIVGPNGSGKSNLIDGLLFVLGFSARKMRHKSNVDLVYCDESGKEKTCFVEVVFVKDGYCTENNFIDTNNTTIDNVFVHTNNSSIDNIGNYSNNNPFDNIASKNLYPTKTYSVDNDKNLYTIENNSNHNSGKYENNLIGDTNIHDTNKYLSSTHENIKSNDNFNETSNLKNPNSFKISGSGKSIFRLRRSIKSGKSIYTLNSLEVPYTVVQSFLSNHGIDTTTSRFLIQQGEIENVSLMKPHHGGMLDYLEEITSTKHYRTQIESLESEHTSLEELTEVKLTSYKFYEKEYLFVSSNLNSVLSSMTSCLNRLNLQSKINSLNIKIIDNQLLLQSHSVHINKKTLNLISEKNLERKNELSKKEEEETEARKKLGIYENMVNEMQKEYFIADKKNCLVKEKRKNLEKSIKGYENMVRERIELNLSREKERCVIEKEICENKKSVIEFEKEANAIKDEILKHENEDNDENCEITDNNKNYLDDKDIKNEESKNSLLNKNFKKKGKSIRCRKTQILNEIKILESSLIPLYSEKGVLNNKIASYNSKIGRLSQHKQNLEKLNTEINHFDIKAIKEKEKQTKMKEKELQKDLDNIEKDISETEKEISDRKNKLDDLIEVENERKRGSKLYSCLNNVDGFLGRLGDLGSVEKKYEIAVSTSGKTQLNSYVVESSKDAEACISIVKKNGIERTSFIVMDKIKEIKNVNKNSYVNEHGSNNRSELNSEINSEYSRNNEIEEKNALNDKFNKNLRVKKDRINECNNEIEEKNVLNDEFNKNLRVKKDRINEYNNEIEEKNALNDKFNYNLRGKKGKINECNNEIEEKNVLNDEFNKNLRVKKDRINEYNNEIEEKNALNDKFNYNLRGKKGKINEYNNEIEEKNILLVDLVSCEDRYKKLFVFALGETILCKDMNEAKKVAFGKERKKVVTLEGNTIEKSGLMSGGGHVSGLIQIKNKNKEKNTTSADLTKKIEKNKNNIEILKSALEKMEKTKNELKNEIENIKKFMKNDIRIEEKEKERNMEIQKIKVMENELVDINIKETKAIYKEINDKISNIKTKINDCTNQIEDMDDLEIKHKKARLGTLIDKIDFLKQRNLRLEKELETLKNEDTQNLIGEMERIKKELERMGTDEEFEKKKIELEKNKKIYSKCLYDVKEIGKDIQEIKDIMGDEFGKEMEVREKIADMENWIGNLKKDRKILGVENRKVGEDAVRIRKHLDYYNENIEAEENLTNGNQNCSDIKNDKIDNKNVDSSNNENNKLIYDSKNNLDKDGSGIESNSDEDITIKNNRKCNDIENNKICDVIENNSDEDNIIKNINDKKNNKINNVNEHDPDEDKVIKSNYDVKNKKINNVIENDSDEDNIITNQINDKITTKNNINDESDILEIKNEIEMLKEKLNKKKKLLKGIEDQSNNINIEIFNEYKRKKKEYLKNKKNLETHQQKIKNLKKSIEEIKKEHLEKFMNGYTEINKHLKQIYQLITFGGNAELEMIDHMNPFSAGIALTVMPPKKSWVPTTNLSGGEKTLASLALVFAIHSYKPSPFYVMDEIDAALDYRNVSVIAEYFLNQNRKNNGKNVQFLVVSLRGELFEKARSMIGVYRNYGMSRITVFDVDRIMGKKMVKEKVVVK